MTRRWLPVVVAIIVLVGAAVVAWPRQVDAVTLPGTFIDDNGNIHENGIEAIAAAGITLGCNPPTNNRFCPNDNVTRAEAATFLARALGLPDDGVDHFTDDDGHVLEGGINRLAASGITKGCNPPANTRFCPDRNLTRAEFAAFVARGLEIDPSSTDHFTDDDGHVLEASINRIADEGITVGCNPPTNNHFCPQRLLTRAETATLLTRALDLPHSPLRIPLSTWSAIGCSRDGKSCSVSIETASGEPHLVEEGFFQRLPYQGGEQSQFTGSGTTFRLTLDGSQVALSQLPIASSSTQALRRWNTTLTFSGGNHVLVGEWRWNGSLIQKTTANISAG
ncbi:MAG: S-layer homology domain-containing protein [Acidimicrobiia bacterium]